MEKTHEIRFTREQAEEVLSRAALKLVPDRPSRATVKVTIRPSREVVVTFTYEEKLRRRRWTP